jgi:excinuclease ABC subunit A
MKSRQKRLASDSIRIRGARQNNLKGCDIDLPLGEMIVISGPSGSGKSSLAFETLYAEGQRRYVETFSPYTRQFFDRMDKPAVDRIEGIPPAIAIQQTNGVRSTRSTVGTITDINDYLKMFLGRLAVPHCPECGEAVSRVTIDSVCSRYVPVKDGADAAVDVLVEVPVPAETACSEVLVFIGKQGFSRVEIGGVLHRCDEAESVSTDAVGTREVLVVLDRIRLGASGGGARLREACESGFELGKGTLRIRREGVVESFSLGFVCGPCGVRVEEATPATFSFNHPSSACPECRGFGRVIEVDLERAVPDRTLSLRGGAVKVFQTENGAEMQEDLMRFAKERGLDVDAQYRSLSDADKQWVMLGEKPSIKGETLWRKGLWYGVRGFFEWLESKSYKMHVRVLLSRYRRYRICPACSGTRFSANSLRYRWNGHTVSDLQSMTIDRLWSEMTCEGALPTEDSAVAVVAGGIISRLQYLRMVGLGYLTLSRSTRSLSGGEVARVNLTTCLGAALVNALFVLDEPSIGLHPRDIGRLLKVMRDLRDRGNTLVVVEHEEAVLRAADTLLEIGPGRGESGGQVVFQGRLETLLKERATGGLTADYLTGRRQVTGDRVPRRPSGWVELEGVECNNLCGVNVAFPLGVLCCVTGVSGSGKSTLVHEVLHHALSKGDEADGAPEAESDTEVVEVKIKAVRGRELVGQVVLVDQSPLTRTPRSTPALYLGVWDRIREMLAATDDARREGMLPGMFSFNAGDGRCERCGGNGFEKVEMQFLSDVYLRCPECEGRRFRKTVREVRLEGLSVDGILDLTISEAVTFFGKLKEERICRPLRVMERVGLGYLRLGQPLNGLSGGESQRLKLVERLAKKSGERVVVILDEPTTGLHFDDIRLLLEVLQEMVDAGDSVVVIEHNMEVIRASDHVIDLGPEAGVDGGKVVATGTPREVAKMDTHTGRHLASILRGAAYCESVVAEVAPAYGRVSEENGAIRVFGARHHNLKNLTVDVPREKLVVVTGLSGSGKSTLAFDLLFAEGQRRFLESMSPYARQFAEQMERPEVDAVLGLPPTVAIEQRLTRGGAKSTVATVTEIYHFLRLLYAKVGVLHCPVCDVPVTERTESAIVKEAVERFGKSRFSVLFPLIRARKGFHTAVAERAKRMGIERLFVDGKFTESKAFSKLDRFREHTIEAEMGRPESEADVTRLVRRALEFGRGFISLLDDAGEWTTLSTVLACPNCDASFEPLDPRLFSFNSPHGRCETCRGYGEVWSPRTNTRLDGALEIEMDEERQFEALEEGELECCPECDGARVNGIARGVEVGGRRVGGIMRMTSVEALDWVRGIRLKGRDAEVARDILPEISQRLEFMERVGLGYLGLGRSARTLSGGESQRIRLASQLGSNLRGVLYILDEPTIGLHPRDNVALLDTLEGLVKRGNSLVVVEHDEEALRRADHVLDLGPGAGRFGGTVVAEGTVAQIARVKESATGRVLKCPLRHPVKGGWRALRGADFIEIKGIHLRNLRDVSVKIPKARLTVVTGVSGSGKSTLVRGVIRPAIAAALAAEGKKGRDTSKEPATDARAQWSSLKGLEGISAVYEVDQSPIGKTPRSTPATYLGIFDDIRKLFAAAPLSRMRGYQASRFSFNTEEGRCSECGGQGEKKIEMNFLPSARVRCPVCDGARFNSATLEVTYQGRNLAEVLAMSMEEAVDYFSAHPSIQRPLKLLCDSGLGYLTLGQASPTLSGGEAQRLKLVTELARGVGRLEGVRMAGGGRFKSGLYILEEPTIGLHTEDVARLIHVLHRLVDEGHTVIVVEHHTGVMAEADYLIDMGPEAGSGGGSVVVAGDLEAVCKSTESRTAPFLRALLGSPQHEAKGKRGKG